MQDHLTVIVGDINAMNSVSLDDEDEGMSKKTKSRKGKVEVTEDMEGVLGKKEADDNRNADASVKQPSTSRGGEQEKEGGWKLTAAEREEFDNLPETVPPSEWTHEQDPNWLKRNFVSPSVGWLQPDMGVPKRCECGECTPEEYDTALEASGIDESFIVVSKTHFGVVRPKKKKEEKEKEKEDDK